MNMKKYIPSAVAVLFATLLPIGFTACSDDENDNKSPEAQSITTFDDLAYFQGIFVSTDSLGNFLNHSLGTPLYASDTTHLYIGVDSIQQALKYWDIALAPDIQRTSSIGNIYTYSLTDADGKQQGTVSFAPGTESGHVAEITTNASGLKHFKQVTFLLNSAWPKRFHAEKLHLLGDIHYVKISLDGWINGDKILRKAYSDPNKIPFICVRQNENGVPPLYVSISKNRTNHLMCDYMPQNSTAQYICSLLHDDWEQYVGIFERLGEGELNGESVWIQEQHHYPFATLQDAINLSTGDISGWDILYQDPERRLLLYTDKDLD